MKKSKEEDIINISEPQQKEKANEDIGSITFRFTKRTFKIIAAVAVLIILLYWGLNKTDKVSYILGKIFAVVEPFILGF